MPPAGANDVRPPAKPLHRVLPDATENPVLAPFLSFFLAHLISLPSACHILPDCCKNHVSGVNYGQSLEMGAIVPPFLHQH